MNTLILIFSLFLSASRGAETGVIDANLVSAKNDFGFRVLSTLVSSAPKENVFISPYSIATALTMTYNGSDGETRSAMAQALGIAGIELERLNTEEKFLSGQLKKDKPGVELLIANSLWARKGVTFNSAFLNTNKEFYQAAVAAIDFNSPDAPKKINNWVKDKTKGKIDKIVDQIKPEAVLFLINAVYFKGRWQEKFDPKMTGDDKFYPDYGNPVPVKMMTRSGKFRYLETEGLQAVELPYGEGEVSMLIFLPAAGKLDDLIAQLSSAFWQEWWGRFRSREGTVLLPRFKMEYEKSLRDVLIELGMGIAFDLNQADFSLMGKGGPGFAIGDVKHKSFVEVNEEGTEAAAVTSVEMVLAAVPSQPRFEMVVNRPFLFAIQDNETGAILFLGVVRNLSRGN
ncbi:serpin family protein [candidate division WOR-3 bacterium]|nr:serpin family protein [candidate division WOR-3 bacterium]